MSQENEPGTHIPNLAFPRDSGCILEIKAGKGLT